jgi:hypothetical protein
MTIFQGCDIAGSRYTQTLNITTDRHGMALVFPTDAYGVRAVKVLPWERGNPAHPFWNNAGESPFSLFL